MKPTHDAREAAGAPPPPPPLAEGRWLWRRLYVFAVSLGLWLLLSGVIDAAPDASLASLARGLMALQALLLVLYLVAPTAQQLIALVLGARGRTEGSPREDGR